MPSELFSCICNDIKGQGLFKHRGEATRPLGIHPQMKMIAVLRLPGYSICYNRQNMFLCGCIIGVGIIGGIPDQVISRFGNAYLHHRMDHGLLQVLSANAVRRFPVCIGRCNCQHSIWHKCPTALSDEFKRRENNQDQTTSFFLFSDLSFLI